MSNETFKTNHGNVPKLTEEDYPVWKQKIRRVLIAKKAYNIVTGVDTWKNDLTRQVTHIEAVFGLVIHSIIDAWHYEVLWICELTRLL
jgi:hypothetical protein